MSLRFEFAADVRDGAIQIPADVAGRLRVRGLERVRVVLTTAAEEEERLAMRGIDGAAIDRVAAAQLFDRDVATVVLMGEGATAGTELGARLDALLPPDRGAL